MQDGNQRAEFVNFEKERDINFKNYSSNITIIYFIANIVVANVITSAARNSFGWIILSFAGFMAFILFIKLV